MPGRVLIAAASFAALAGCMSQQELRARAPAFTQEVPGARANVAGCVVDELRTQMPAADLVVTDRPDQNVTRVASRNVGFAGPTGQYFWEVAITQSAPRAVTIEGRAFNSLRGTPNLPSSLPDVVARCGQVAQGTPSQR